MGVVGTRVRVILNSSKRGVGVIFTGTGRDSSFIYTMV